MDNVLPEVLDGLLEDQPPCLAPDIVGMTSPKVRMLLNRLVGMLPPDEAYLEIGTHRGSTLISALLDNTDKTAYACDDFSGFREAGDPEPDFRANLETYKKRLPPVTFYKMDCFDLSKMERPFEKPIGVYFYDGFHNRDTQYRAITEYARFWARKTIIVIDDWNWDWLQEATWRGLGVVRPKKLWFQELPSRGDADHENFWNGVGAFYVNL
jgi:hypothetical protein